MLDPMVTAPLFHVPAFSFALIVGIAVSLGVGLRRAQRPGAVVDVCLAALALALVGARIVHVLLNWSYFADNLSEALRPSAGGLDWHGVVIGALIGLALAARWRRLSARDLLDQLTPALPLLALAGWIGCAAAVCGWGAEVDTLAHYSPFVASESRDVYGIIAPRYNTQVFGMVLALVLLIVSLVLIQRGWLRYRRFWLVLAFLSLGMFVIGFFRGDPVPMVAGLRADQVLDTGVFIWSIYQAGAVQRRITQRNIAA